MTDENFRGRPPVHRGFAVGMLALALLCFGGLFYFADFDSAFGGVTALLLMPFALGALTTQIGFFHFEKIGCLIAPVALFAILFPFVYFGMAEGLVCILIVLPLWLAAGLGGALSSYVTQKRANDAEIEEAKNRFRSTGWIILPMALFMVEEVAPPVWTTHEVKREIEINAPAATVWPLLVSIPDIREDEGRTNFTHDIAGVARPTEAKLVRREDQLVRLARWGDNIRFEEQITAIKPGRTIAWDFAFPDDSIQQYTDRHIAPQGAILHIERGRYDLVETDAGRSVLRLTTSYRMRSRMGFYLEWWGEKMLGDVQDNVLTIVKQRSEISNQQSTRGSGLCGLALGQFRLCEAFQLLRGKHRHDHRQCDTGERAEAKPDGHG